MHDTDFALILPALLTGLLVLTTHVPLGLEVLRRGIIFIDLAIAQVAALGVMLAHLLELNGSEDTHGLQVQLFAVGAALAAAGLLSWTDRRWPDIQEALIGLLFVFAASLGIVLLAGNPHGGEHLRDLLAGQILWVGIDRLWPVALLYALLLAAWWGLRRHAPRLVFYLVFALAVTASVQLVGVFLVFASLIAPAVAAQTLPASHPRAALRAYATGAAGYALGLLASLYWDLPAGAAVVCALCLCVAISLAGREAARAKNQQN